jgi:hypothetical protein
MRRARGSSELIGFARQNDDGSFKAILAEVAVKGESVIEPVMIDQSEAGAIDETKVFVIVSDENRLGCLFILFGGSKRLDPGPIETFHNLNGGRVANLKADQRVSFAKDKIRCYPAELLNEATRCEPISRRSDSRRLHQRGQETRRYRERLSIDRGIGRDFRQGREPRS